MNKQSKANMAASNLILAFVLTCFSSAALAQSKASPVSQQKIAVRYLGSEEDMILVGVHYESIQSGKLMLSIYNEDGDVVFRNGYQTSKLEKQFKVPKDHGKLTFVFSGAKERASRTFVIYSHSKMVENLVVKKLD